MQRHLRRRIGHIDHAANVVQDGQVVRRVAGQQTGQHNRHQYRRAVAAAQLAQDRHAGAPRGVQIRPHLPLHLPGERGKRLMALAQRQQSVAGVIAYRLSGLLRPRVASHIERERMRRRPQPQGIGEGGDAQRSQRDPKPLRARRQRGGQGGGQFTAAAGEARFGHVGQRHLHRQFRRGRDGFHPTQPSLALLAGRRRRRHRRDQLRGNISGRSARQFGHQLQKAAQIAGQQAKPHVQDGRAVRQAGHRRDHGRSVTLGQARARRLQTFGGLRRIESAQILRRQQGVVSERVEHPAPVGAHRHPQRRMARDQAR